MAALDVGAGLPVRRPDVRYFTDGTGVRLRAAEQRTIEGLLEPYGRSISPPSPTGRTFAAMGEGLLTDLERPLPHLDLIILAYAEPDITVAEVAGCYLADLCPGTPTGFSVSGSGVGAPFTALRILQAARAAGEIGDGAVFAFDQSASLYRAKADAERDCAVLLTIDDRDPDRLVLEIQPEIQIDDLTDIPFAGPPGARFIAGRELTERLGSAPSDRTWTPVVTPGCTAIWAALAAHWSPEQHIVVAEYDCVDQILYQALLSPVSE
ncbi:hypothetical protein [Micromonospora marina]|uniref:hypothetical protein n=2 Tax=Micromonospora marina TaxID=307120 RepID=UPI000B82697F